MSQQKKPSKKLVLSMTMSNEHILSELISEKTAFNKNHLGLELLRRFAEKDAQLAVCVEHLKRIKANHKIHNSDDYIHTIFLNDVNEALEKVGVV